MGGFRSHKGEEELGRMSEGSVLNEDPLWGLNQGEHRVQCRFYKDHSDSGVEMRGREEARQVGIRRKLKQPHDLWIW